MMRPTAEEQLKVLRVAIGYERLRKVWTSKVDPRYTALEELNQKYLLARTGTNGKSHKLGRGLTSSLESIITRSLKACRTLFARIAGRA